jgi:hypothetical protein
MKLIRTLPVLLGLLTFAASLFAQTTDSTTFAPANFSDFILTSTPSNATGASGISTIYSTSGEQLTFGTGGALINPTKFNYQVTGPNSATITLPATDTAAAATTNLVFTGRNSGTYTTTQGNSTTTGHFNLSNIPFAAPLSNMSVRSTLGQNGSTIIGFVIAGTQPRRVLIRAVGPGLAQFGVTDAVQNPQMTLYSGQQALVTNSDWTTTATLDLSGSTLLSGSTTTTGSTSTSGSTTGTTSTGTTSLSSTSTGSTSGTGSTTSTGTTTTTNSGETTGTLPNGSSFSTSLATAQNFSDVGAFPLVSGRHDAAFVATLPPGAYTVVVTNAGASVTATTSSGTGTTSGGTTTGSTSSTSGSTTMGTSTSSTSSGSTTTGTTTGAGSTSGGTSTGTSSTGTTSTGTTSTGTTSVTTSTNGEVLLEVYFLQ